jgi:hypothetical protein
MKNPEEQNNTTTNMDVQRTRKRRHVHIYKKTSGALEVFFNEETREKNKRKEQDIPGIKEENASPRKLRHL